MDEFCGCMDGWNRAFNKKRRLNEATIYCFMFHCPAVILTEAVFRIITRNEIKRVTSQRKNSHSEQMHIASLVFVYVSWFREPCCPDENLENVKSCLRKVLYSV